MKRHSLLCLITGIIFILLTHAAFGQTLIRSTVSSGGGISFTQGGYKYIQCIGEPAIGANSLSLNGSAFGFLSGEGIEEGWMVMQPTLCKGASLKLKKVFLGDEISNFRWIVFKDSIGNGLIADSIVLSQGQDTLHIQVPLWLPTPISISVHSDLGEVFSQLFYLIPPDTLAQNATICAGSSFVWNGDTLRNSGTYLKNKFDSLGCLQIHRIRLQTLPIKKDSIQSAICARSAYYFGGRWLNQTGYYLDTLMGGSGCDSIVSLRLSVIEPVFTSLHDSLCTRSVYFFNGRWLNQGGTYFDTLVAANGCDSIVSLRLDFKPPFLSPVQTITICQGDSLFFQGDWLKTHGLYTDTLLNIAGCDSVIRLQLMVNVPWSQCDTFSLCAGDSLFWQGRFIKLPGDYSKSWNGSNTCDSVYFIHLKLIPLRDTLITRQICSGQSFQFNQQNLTQTGTYLAYFPASNGCDSLVRLMLQVNNLSNRLLRDTICEGQIYPFQGIPLTQSGAYTVFLTNSAGCDSILTLELYVRFRPAKPLVIRVLDSLYSSAVSGNQWFDLQGSITGATLNYFVPSNQGSYFVRVGLSGCLSEPSDTISFTGTSAQAFTKSEWILYPNPAQDFVQIQGSEFQGENYEWRVMKHDGALVKQGSSYTSHWIVSTENWSNGIYLMQIILKDRIQFLRFVIAK